MNIWYFAEPTIGYCPDCKIEAIYKERQGVAWLVCPACDNADELSIFTWDETSRYPEEE